MNQESRMGNTRISIIIPAYNEERYIGRCLESLLRHRHPALLEVIVVDNCSTDATAVMAARFAGVRVVREDRKGAAFARQRGFDESKGDIVAFLDADTEMGEGWFDAVVAEFSAETELAALSGPYYYYDVSRWQDWCVRAFWYCLALPAYALTRYMAVGGNMAVRRRAFERSGGFDTSIPFYGDDTDIARRLCKEGKVKFKFSFTIRTSGRRFREQGILRTGLLYGGNFLAEVLFHRPLTKSYKDFR